MQVYHHLGSEIYQRQQVLSYGAKFIECLENEINEAFREFSRNPKNMVLTFAFSRFAETLGRDMPSIAEIEAELAGELNTGS